MKLQKGPSYLVLQVNLSAQWLHHGIGLYDLSSARLRRKTAYYLFFI